MWVYGVAPFLCLKACLWCCSLDKKLCGVEVYRVEKSDVWIEVVLRTPKWAIDDNKFVEFLSIHILLT